MPGGTVAAVDLGATSGRVMLGHVSPTELALRPVARFPNTPVRTIDGLHWNILELYRNVLAGLATAARETPIASIGIDSWAVDYALIRGERMWGNPSHYRDERTAGGVAAVHSRVSPAELYRANGLQHLPFTTLFQLETEELAGIDTMLLVPDLISFWITGRRVAERTNASTTGLLDPVSGQWNESLIARLGFPRRIFPELVSPGSEIGPLLPGVAAELGLGTWLAIDSRQQHPVVTAIGSHDTASAVVAVPATSPDFAYISCGTWGLVGVELESPILSEAGRAANFTNEGGVDGRIRFLHNVMGLWLLSESVRTWERLDGPIDLPALLAQAAAVTTPVAVFDANDARFLPPGDLPMRITEYCAEHVLRPPGSRPEMVRSIIESLAVAFAEAVETASELSGVRVDVVHLVGGGSQNELLCQLTADRLGRRVIAGPVEATAIGNVLVQSRAQGFMTGDLEAMRALVVRSHETRVYRAQTN
ncbi:MAG: rhamnulokinase [Burkholderiaceae bacterium]|nr:rhamnulokinase [Microbacteriaceae bacterium]